MSFRCDGHNVSVAPRFVLYIARDPGARWNICDVSLETFPQGLGMYIWNICDVSSETFPQDLCMRVCDVGIPSMRLFPQDSCMGISNVVGVPSATCAIARPNDPKKKRSISIFFICTIIIHP